MAFRFFDLDPRDFPSFLLKSMSKHNFMSIEKAQDPEGISSELNSAFPDITCQFL